MFNQEITPPLLVGRGKALQDHGQTSVIMRAMLSSSPQFSELWVSSPAIHLHMYS